MRAQPHGWVRNVLTGMILVGGILLSILAAIVVFFATALVTSWISVMTSLAILVFLLIAVSSARFAAKRLGISQRRRFGSLIGLGGLAVVILVAWVTVFRPAPLPGALEPLPDMQYWTLAPGSRLAYVHYAAQGRPKETPLIFLHGGPGGPLTQDNLRLFQQFTQDGFDVYLYEQIGTGHSDRSADLRDYSVKRNVDDLEAIRQTLGADQMVLAGSSWGGELAATYLGMYPEHVAKVILMNPSQLWGAPELEADYGRTAGTDLGVKLSPRAIVTFLLLSINPQAAQNLTSQQEMGAFMDQQAEQFVRVSYCAEDADNVPMLDPTKPIGFNFYVNRLVQEQTGELPELRPRLRTVQTPVLLLRGECDYIPWEAHREYRDLLPNTTHLYIENAGHSLGGTQMELTTAAIRAFLLDQPLPLEAYTGENDPATASIRR